MLVYGDGFWLWPMPKQHFAPWTFEAFEPKPVCCDTSDDIVVYWVMLEEHMGALRAIFQICRHNQL